MPQIDVSSIDLTRELIRRWRDDPGMMVCDIFRVADGLIVEHWDVIQDIAPAGPNPNPPW